MSNQSNWVYIIRIMFDNPWLTFFLFLTVVEAIRAVIISFINRNKPAPIKCPCHENEEEEDEQGPC